MSEVAASPQGPPAPSWPDFLDAFALDGTDPGASEFVFFGRRLRPFCLYYQMQLERIGSPLIIGGDVEVKDLEIAARICTCRFGEGHRASHEKLSPLRMAQFLARAWKLQPQAELKTWHRYLSAYLDTRPNILGSGEESKAVGPDGKVTDQAPDNSPFPGTLDLYGTLLTFPSLTDRQIQMMPLHRATWLATKAWRDNGREIRLVSPDKEANIRAQKDACKDGKGHVIAGDRCKKCGLFADFLRRSGAEIAEDD